MCATGGGPQGSIIMSDLENRALFVWGKVVVEGSNVVPESGGLQSIPENVDTVIVSEVGTANDNEDSQNYVIIKTDNVEMNNFIMENEIIEVDKHNNGKTMTNVDNALTSKTFATKDVTMRKKRVVKNNLLKKPLNESVTSLLQTYEKSLLLNETLNTVLNKISETYTETERNKNILKEKKLKLKEKKLNFEIAKYKYENKDFIFE